MNNCGIKLCMICLVAAGLTPASAWPEGHGPVFALATPTLGKGGWSSDTVLMTNRTEAGNSPVSLGQMLGYGLNEDLQINLKVPIARSGNPIPQPPNMRAGMMGAPRDVEASLMWRFHRRAPAVGTRRESTLHFGMASARESRRRGVEVSESLHAALATGHASRSTYWWLSAGLQRPLAHGNDRLGELYYAGAVFGYRPQYFRAEETDLDLRWFVEAVAEFPQSDRRGGEKLHGTGGERLLAGPTFLALGGPWGLSGGILYPVYENMRSAERDERYRAKLVVTYWF